MVIIDKILVLFSAVDLLDLNTTVAKNELTSTT